MFRTSRARPVLALLGLMVVGVLTAFSLAYAQTSTVTKSAGSTAVLAWLAPVANTDGTPIATGTPITYTVYSGTTKAVTGLTALTWTTGPLTVGTPCWAVTATEAGVESAQSTQVCITVVAPTPNPPAGLTVH